MKFSFENERINKSLYLDITINPTSNKEPNLDTHTDELLTVSEYTNENH